MRQFLLNGWSFGLGLGLIPVAPGTFGTLLAIPIGWLMIASSFRWLLFLFLLLLSVYACSYTMKVLNKHDPKQIVSDEVIGMLLLILLIKPVVWSMWVMCFVLFRLYDIWKPWPICWVDNNVENAFGVMLDDLIAALFAFISIKVMLVFW